MNILDSNDPVSQGIEGYWYPDGDRESTEYFSIYNGTLYFYKFDPEQGDVQNGMLNLSTKTFRDRYHQWRDNF